MKRRELIALLGGAALAWPLAARAQPGERTRRIGVLMSFAAGDPEARLRVAALEKGLRELGWVEGRNLRTEYRWADNADVLHAYATELVGMAPDLIVANSTPVMDPVGQGLVPNLAHPGGTLTGFTTFEFSIGTKWLQTLKDIAPRITRVAIIFNPVTAPFADLFWRPIAAAAPSFSVQPISAGVRDTDELERIVEAFAREPDGALLVLPDVSTVNHRGLIIALAARHRLPAIYPYRFFAASGGLCSYGVDVADVFRRAASYVDRILRGTRAGELPVQAPDKYEVVINLKTAKALGLDIPATVLARADE